MCCGGSGEFRDQAGRCEYAQGDSRFFEKASTAQEPFCKVAMARIGRSRKFARSKSSKTHDLLLGVKCIA